MGRFLGPCPAPPRLDRPANGLGTCPRMRTHRDIAGTAAMKQVLIMVCLAVEFASGGTTRAADRPLVLDVWPGKAVGDHGQIGPERVRAAAEAPTKDAKWITNVTRPTISVFRPDAGNELPGRDGDLPGGRVLEPGVGQGGRGGGGVAQYAGHHGGGAEVSRAATAGRAGAAARTGAVARCAAGDPPGAQPGRRVGHRPGADRDHGVLGRRASGGDDGDLVREALVRADR